MAEPRKSYNEGCIAAHALDLIGDRWALLVVRELMLGAKRFGAIKQRLPGIATNMLTRRLDDLASAGIIRHCTLPPPANVAAYELTDQGHALGPVMRELCRWGVGMPGHDPRLPISPTALMISMQAMLLPGPGDHAASFDLEGERFLFTIRDGHADTLRTDDPQAEIRFAGTANGLAPVIYGPAPLAMMVGGGLVDFSGDPEAGQAFVDRFRLARPAA